MFQFSKFSQRLFHKIRTNQDGVVAIETAFVLPVFLVMVFGILEVSMIFINKHQMNHTMRRETTLSKVGGNVCIKKADFIEALCKGLISAKNCTNDMNVRQSRFANFNQSTNPTIPDQWNMPNGQGDVMAVQVNFDMPVILPYLDKIMGGKEGKVSITESFIYRNEPWERTGTGTDKDPCKVKAGT